MRFTLWLAAGALVFGCTAASAELSGAALQAQVQQAVMRDLSLNEQQTSEIRLLASGLHLPGQPRLNVAAVRTLGEANTRLLRLECDSRTQCIPFEAVLGTSGPKAQSAHLAVASRDRSSSSAWVVRPGQRVQLVEEISGMNLSTAGICLQAGTFGRRIRVRNAASGRVVLARVRTAGLVAVED